MPEAEYHAHSALSSTGARRILDSPARFLYEQAHPQAPKTEFDLGTAVHSKVLGVGHPVEVIPNDLLSDDGGVRSNAAKAWVAAARDRGITPVKASVAAEVDEMAESVLRNADARGLLEVAGNAEASVFATDPDTGVDLRARFDFLPDGLDRLCVDLKTANDASPDGFRKAVEAHGYHVQRSHYLDTLQLVTGTRSSEFRFVVVESKPPYLTAVYSLDLDFCDMGDVEARDARAIYAACMKTDEWPGYPDGTTELRPSLGRIYRHQERYGEIGR